AGRARARPGPVRGGARRFRSPVAGRTGMRVRRCGRRPSGSRRAAEAAWPDAATRPPPAGVRSFDRRTLRSPAAARRRDRRRAQCSRPGDRLSPRAGRSGRTLRRIDAVSGGMPAGGPGACLALPRARRSVLGVRAGKVLRAPGRSPMMARRGLARPRDWLATWRRRTADPASAGRIALAVLLAVALGLLGWSAARTGTRMAGDVVGIERDHRVQAVTRLADDALAALRATVSSAGWKGAAAGREKASARLEAEGSDLAAIAAGLDASRDRDDGRGVGSSAAADYRWAIGELRSALAPLLASAAIESIRVVRRADGRILHDSIGESLGRLAPEVLDALVNGRIQDGLLVAAYPTLDSRAGGVTMVVTESRNGPLVLTASLALASAATGADANGRMTLIDESGRMRSWRNGQPTAVSEEAARMYRAALASDPDPAASLAVAR